MSDDWNAFLAGRGAVRRGATIAHFGDPAGEARAALDADIVTDLGHLGLISVSGEDTVTFLQGQLTSDVAEITPERAQVSAWCSPKGRVLATFLVFRHADSLVLQLPRELLDGTLARLRMFVLRADAALEDASERWARIGACGPRVEKRLAEELGAIPRSVDGVLRTPKATVIRLRGVRPRFEVVASPAEMPALWEACREVADAAGADAWELLDIEAGVPTVREATADVFLPQMLDLPRLGGVSFTKGCYVGQEVVARTEHLGRLKRRLYLAHAGGAATPRPGEPVLGPDDDAQAAGRVVQAQPVPDGGYDLLAVIHIETAEAAPTGGLRLESGAALELKGVGMSRRALRRSIGRCARCPPRPRTVSVVRAAFMPRGGCAARICRPSGPPWRGEDRAWSFAGSGSSSTTATSWTSTGVPAGTLRRCSCSMGWKDPAARPTPGACSPPSPR